MFSQKNIIRLSSFTLVSLLLAFQACKKSEPVKEEDMNEWYSGGKQTVFVSGSGAFSQVFSGLASLKADLHGAGDGAFEATFNSDRSQRNHGLGPIFNNQSCGSCHIADGRGKAPNAGENLSSLLLRISIAGENPYGAPNPVPGFGGQLQQRGVTGITAEANVSVSYTENNFQFPDGERYSLREPKFNITNSYLPLPANIMVSARMATPVFGLGLLESIEESAIVANADEQDADGDGISGKPNYAYDVQSKRYKLGRFGWKAAQPSIIQQSAGAYVENMGVTNMIFPSESAYGQTQYDNATKGYELEDSTLYAVAYYIKTLAVPGRRDVKNAEVVAGKKIFIANGCAKCHIPMQHTTTDLAFPELSNQTIFPYTDLLLHDMGNGLADNRPDNKATGTEWRTSPLWGIGLTNTVNGHNNFLHDGRARNLTEAILWHGGEAETAKNNFKNSGKADRDALLKFLNSL
jgi:CxxC motif-containing protein (DUF1111 family)